MANVNLLLKDLTVNNVNMLNGLLVAGFPSICSFVGFANAIAFHYNETKAKIAIAHHGMNYNGDIEYNNLLRRFKINGLDQPTSKSEINKKSIALSSQAHCLSMLKCSLYISIDTEQPDMLYCALNKDKENNKLLHLLKTKFKIAGGQIIDVGEIKIEENMLNLIKNENSLFVLDRKDILNDNNSLLDDTVNTIYKSKTEKNNNYLSLNNVGYLLLTELKEKNNVRQNKKHAFVEPIFNFIECKKINNDTNNVFWHMTKKENAYICETTNITQNENEIEIDF